DARPRRRVTDDVEHAVDLDSGRDRLAAGARRLAADVDDVGSVGDEAVDMRLRRVAVEVTPAVAEGVRRHVADAHQGRASSRDSAPEDALQDLPTLLRFLRQTPALALLARFASETSAEADEAE